MSKKVSFTEDEKYESTVPPALDLQRACNYYFSCNIFLQHDAFVKPHYLNTPRTKHITIQQPTTTNRSRRGSILSQSYSIIYLRPLSLETALFPQN